MLRGMLKPGVGGRGRPFVQPTASCAVAVTASVSGVPNPRLQLEGSHCTLQGLVTGVSPDVNLNTLWRTVLGWCCGRCWQQQGCWCWGGMSKDAGQVGGLYHWHRVCTAYGCGQSQQHQHSVRVAGYLPLYMLTLSAQHCCTDNLGCGEGHRVCGLDTHVGYQHGHWEGWLQPSHLVHCYNFPVCVVTGELTSKRTGICSPMGPTWIAR